MLNPNYDTRGMFRDIPADEAEAVDDDMRLFNQLSFYRTQAFASHWEEVSELVDPNSRNTFVFGNYNTPGMKKTDRQVDATGMMALERFAAICDSLLTPRNMRYQRLKAGGVDSDYIMKDKKTREWFETATERLFYYRYQPEANFASQNNANYRSLGAYGNHAMFVDELDDPGTRGLRYCSVPLGELFFVVNHQNRVVGVVRWMRMTAYMAECKWPGQLPPPMQTALLQNSQEQWFDFLHVVVPRTDYDPQRLDGKGKKWRSNYVCMTGKCMMRNKAGSWDNGYSTFPYAVGRYTQGPHEVYGRGWGMMVLPSLKTLNAQKRVFLTQGHKAAAPVYLSYDDGLVDFSQRPGAMNPGGVSADGKPLVHALPVGDINISKEMMEEERNIINDAALVTLFQILVKTPQMSATEVIERANEKGILLAPTMGRQQDEYIGPMTDRELDRLSYMGLLPPMPPRLREARGSYHVVYDNPLSRLAKAQQSAGFMRTLESVKELVNITQDMSLLDPFKFPVAIPAIADQNAVPESWMDDDAGMAKKAKSRAQAMARKQQLDALPNQAAMISAQAKATAAGSNQPQQPQQPPQQQGA